MFNVKALVPGVFCLDLEDGAINIRHDQVVNLDLLCSREWIEHDPAFRSLINRVPPIIMVVFDSATAGLPEINLMSVSQAATNMVPQLSSHVQQSRLVAPVAPPVNVPVPTSDVEPIVINLATNAVTPPRTEVKTEPATLTVEDTTKKYDEAALRRMYLNDLKLLAASLNISLTPPISKIRLVRAILEKYQEVA